MSQQTQGWKQMRGCLGECVLTVCEGISMPRQPASLSALLVPKIACIGSQAWWWQHYFLVVAPNTGLDHKEPIQSIPYP
jgi:hypothetical protein